MRRPAAILLTAALCACSAPDTPSPSPAAAAPSTGASPDSSPGVSPPATDAAGAASWRLIGEAPFARLEMATAAHDGRIWLAGGLDPLGAALHDVAIFDPATANWGEGSDLPVDVHHAGLVSDGTRLLLVGGYVGSGFNAPSDRTWVLEEDAAVWTEGPPLPSPRAAGAAAWDGGRVVYAGGVGPGGVAADIYALADGEWRRLGALPRPREHLAAASDGTGTVWFLGGRVGALDTNLGDVAAVSGDDVRDAGAPLTPRGGVAAFWAAGIGACLTGGEAPDAAFRTVECVAADGAVSGLPDLQEPRHGHGTAVVGSSVYTLLGGPQPGLTASSSVEVLELD